MSTACLTLFHMGGGGGGADSALLQIVFFITSVRDAARDIVTWPYLVRAHAKNWSNCIYIAITFEILVQNK